MKNVRLFAVAASLGMFASVVSAAEPKVTVKWSNEDLTAVKVDMGEKLIVATPTVTVTDESVQEVTGSVYAVQPAINDDQHWLNTVALNWTSAEASLESLGLNGYRFLAPGAAEVEEDVFVNQYDNVVYADEAAAFKALIEKKLITVEYDEDGDIKTVVAEYDKTKYAASTNVKSVSYLKITSEGTKKADEYIMEAVVNFYVKGGSLKSTSDYKVESFDVNTVAVATKYPQVDLTFDEGKNKINLITANDASAYSAIAQKGLILVVDSGKKAYTAQTATLGSQGYQTVALIGGEDRYEYVVNKANVAETLTKKSASALAPADVVFFTGETGETGTAIPSLKAAGTSDTTLVKGGLVSGTEGSYFLAEAATASKTGTGVTAVAIKVGYTSDTAATYTYDGTTDSRWEDSKGEDATAKVTAAFTITGSPNDGDTVTYTPATKVVGIYNGTKVVTAAYKGVAGTLTQKTYGISDMSTANTYLATASVLGQTVNVPFTTADLTYYTKLAKSATDAKPVNDKYIVADASIFTKGASGVAGVLDAVAYVTTDNAGNNTTNVANYTDNDIYYQVQSTDDKTAEKLADGTKNPLCGTTTGQLVKITSGNYKKLFTLTNLTSEFLYVGSTKLDSAVFTKTNGNVSGLAGLIEADMDFVSYDVTGVAAKAYNKNGINSADTFFVNGYTLEEFAQDATVSTYTLAKQQTNDEYNQITKLAKPGTITVVDVSDVDVSSDVTGKVTEYTGASVVTRLTVAAQADYDVTQKYLISIDDFTVELSHEDAPATLKNIDGVVNEAVEGYNHAEGIYEIENMPENNTEYYVLVTDKTGLDLTGVWAPVISKEIGTLTFADGTEEDGIKAVQLEKKGAWYPAFETKEALEAAVIKLTGVGTALVGTSKDKTNTTFKKWYTQAYKDVNVSELIDLTLPTSAEVTATKPQTSTTSDVTVTSNKDSIDTSKAGVYTLTYSTTYKDVEYTKDVTVVVAPKYAREYKNGRVVKLTSYYLSDTTKPYAVYEYDWSAKKANVTYYNIDGSVADSEVIAL